jgi:hypothetical protein
MVPFTRICLSGAGGRGGMGGLSVAKFNEPLTIHAVELRLLRSFGVVLNSRTKTNT